MYAIPADIDWTQADIARIRELKDTLEKAVATQRASSEQYVGHVDVPVRDFESYIRTKIVDLDSILAPMSKTQRTYHMKEQRRLEELYRVLRYITEQKEHMGHMTVAAPKKLYDESLRIRLQSVSTIYENRLKLDEMERYQKPHKWYAQDLEEFEQEISISTAAAQDATMKDAYALTNGGFAYDAWLLRDIHPNVMPDTKEEYLLLLESETSRLEEKMKQNKDLRRSTRMLSQQHAALLRLLAAAQNDFFPLPEGKGLPAVRFWNAVYEKGMRVRLTAQLPDLKTEQQQIDRNWNQAVFNTFLFSLRAKLQSNQQELQTLQADKAQKKFLEQMRLTGFTRKVSSQ